MEDDVAKRVATSIPYNSPCRIEAERPKFVKEPRKEAVHEADANVTEREARGEAGDGVMDASEATKGEEEERRGSAEREAIEIRSCSAWCWRVSGGRAREGNP